MHGCEYGCVSDSSMLRLTWAGNTIWTVLRCCTETTGSHLEKERFLMSPGSGSDGGSQKCCLQAADLPTGRFLDPCRSVRICHSKKC